MTLKTFSSSSFGAKMARPGDSANCPGDGQTWMRGSTVTDDSPPLERWAPIPDWEGFYEVSDRGRVRSLDREVTASDGSVRRFRGQVRALQLHQERYRLKLSRPGYRQIALVHQLMLFAFVGPRPEGMVARHLNDDSTDNRLENLAWGTFSENNHDQVRNKTHYESRRTHCDNGHEYTPDNVALRRASKGGQRRCCRACERAASMRYLNRKRAQAQAIEHQAVC